MIAISVVLSGISTGIAGPGMGTAFADCPNPSWVQLKTDGGRLDSRYPGQRITVPASSWVTHWGDVKPGTSARFGYDSYGPFGNYLGGRSHTTENAQNNGVIDHDEEWRHTTELIISGASTVVVSFLFTDECTGNLTNGRLGSL